MLVIRQQRFGKKKAPAYRIAVMEKSDKRDGEPVEVLGNYNPKTKELILNKERAQYWISKGAQPSDTVAYLLTKEPDHNLAEGVHKPKAMSRDAKEKRRVELIQTRNKKNTKAKRKKAEAAAASATAA